MASAQDVASKLKWLLHSLTALVKEKGEALLLPIIFLWAYFFSRLVEDKDNDCQGRNEATAPS